jgi:hypothetical protein
VQHHSPLLLTNSLCPPVLCLPSLLINSSSIDIAAAVAAVVAVSDSSVVAVYVLYATAYNDSARVPLPVIADVLVNNLVEHTLLLNNSLNHRSRRRNFILQQLSATNGSLKLQVLTLQLELHSPASSTAVACPTEALSSSS